MQSRKLMVVSIVAFGVLREPFSRHSPLPCHQPLLVCRLREVVRLRDGHLALCPEASWRWEAAALPAHASSMRRGSVVCLGRT